MKKIFENVLILAVMVVLAGCATTLMNAAEKGDINTLKALLDKGADIDDKDAALWSAAWAGHAEAVKLLLDADVSAVAVNWAFKWAVYGGHNDVVRVLLDKGANISSKDYFDIGRSVYGETPLGAAAMRGHTEIVKTLLSKNADIDEALAGLEKCATSILPSAGDCRSGIKLLEKFAKKQETIIQPIIPSPKPSQEVSPIPKSDVDELPPMKAKPNKNSYAIVIGIEQYRQKLPKADFAAHDAQTVTEYITKVMGYPEENVVTLTNDRALKSDFEKYFEKWLWNNVEKDGTVFIYYSGHGAPNPKTGDAYLVPYDGDPSFIDETGYPLKRLYASLGKLPAKEIVVALDSCFSGAGGRSVLAKGARPLVMTMEKTAIPSNTTVLSAASGEQISSTYEEKGHGLFTYFMLKGIKGEGDANSDRNIEIGELFEYIKPNVEKIARKIYNNEQMPQIIAPSEKHKMILIEGAK